MESIFDFVSTDIADLISQNTSDVDKVETPIHGSIRELVKWECKEHGVKS